jgi:antirestriction protein ArdC
MARKREASEKKRDLRLELADRLIEQIESGNARWQKPWEDGEVQPPVNAVTGQPYHGVNYQNLMLFSPDPSDNRWCTYKQAKAQGWQVREGEHGISIEKWTPYERKLTPEEKQELRDAGRTEIPDSEQRFGVRNYTVFHASQIDGIPPIERPERGYELEGKPDPRIEGLAEAMGVEVRRGGSKAFYRPSEDFVRMPFAEDFHTAKGHDTVFLHELSHATSHENRLNRELKNPFGSEKYALEELRAEMSAAMTAAALGIGFDPAAQGKEEGRETETSAAYLAGWLKALPDKDRKQILTQAIKDAQGISDYLLERTPEIEIAAPEKAKEVEVVAPVLSTEKPAPQVGDRIFFTPIVNGKPDPEMAFSGKVLHIDEKDAERYGRKLIVETDAEKGLTATVNERFVEMQVLQRAAEKAPEKRLEESLTALDGHTIKLNRADGMSRDVGAKAYLSEGIKRGYSQALDDDKGTHMRNPQTGKEVAIEDTRLADTLRAARAVDPDLSKSLASIVPQQQRQQAQNKGIGL